MSGRPQVGSKVTKARGQIQPTGQTGGGGGGQQVSLLERVKNRVSELNREAKLSHKQIQREPFGKSKHSRVFPSCTHAILTQFLVTGSCFFLGRAESANVSVRI